jgi:hypothetical protein
MHAVEIADRDGSAAEISGQVVEGAKKTHSWRAVGGLASSGQPGEQWGDPTEAAGGNQPVLADMPRKKRYTSLGVPRR